ALAWHVEPTPVLQRETPAVLAAGNAAIADLGIHQRPFHMRTTGADHIRLAMVLQQDNLGITNAHRAPVAPSQVHQLFQCHACHRSLRRSHAKLIITITDNQGLLARYSHVSTTESGDSDTVSIPSSINHFAKSG